MGIRMIRRTTASRRMAVLAPMGALALAIVLNFLLYIVMGNDPAAVFYALLLEPFVSWSSFSEVLLKMTPLLLIAQGLAIGFRANNLMAMLAAARAGMGAAVLPCFMGDQETELARLKPPLAKAGSELWLLTHEDLRNTARVRAFMDFMAAAIQSDRNLLEGRRAA